MTNAQTVKTELTTWQQFKQLKGWIKFYAGLGMYASAIFLLNAAFLMTTTLMLVIRTAQL